MRTYFITGRENCIRYHICKLLAERDEETKIVTYDAQKHYIPLDASDWPYYMDHRIRSLDGKDVEQIRGDTTDRGIPTRVTYEPVHLTRYYREEWGYKDGDIPVTEDVFQKILTLPFHMGLDSDDLVRIASEVEAFFHER